MKPGVIPAAPAVPGRSRIGSPLLLSGVYSACLAEFLSGSSPAGFVAFGSIDFHPIDSLKLAIKDGSTSHVLPVG